MSVLAFSFKNNISEQVLKKLNLECRYYLSNGKDIYTFVELIKKEKPKYVIGLGMYSGKDHGQLRLETICKNKFRNNFIDNVENYNLTTIVLPSPVFKYGKAMGNSYCNLISYKIMKMIKNEDLNTKYYFIHIPKSFDRQLAIKEIESVVASVANPTGS